MNRLALESRCALAMARVVAPCDPRAAALFEDQAIKLAGDAGWRQEKGYPPPKLFDNEPALLAAFVAGEAQADAHAALIETHPALV